MENKQYTICVSSVLDAADGFIKYLVDTYGENKLADKINPGLEFMRKMDPADRIPVDLVLAFYHEVNDDVREPYMGLKAIEHLTKNKIPAFTFVRDGYYHFIESLKIYQRYIVINDEIIGSTITETDEAIIVKFILNSEYVSQSRHQLEGAALFHLKFLEYVNGPAPYKIHFDHSPVSSDLSVYEKYLGVTPVFDQPFSGLFFKKEESRKMVGCGGQDYDVVSRIGRLESDFERIPNQESNTEKVRFVLSQLMYLGEPSKEQVASIFSITSRTLHRYLQKESTTFNEVLIALRKEISVKYLEEDTFSCGEIAFLLGYKDSSQFFKSFKLWFGCSPVEYKRQLGSNVAEAIS